MSWWTGDIRNYSNEEFHGYFSEIRLVAMRTLPRKPPKEILSLLQTTAVHSPYAQTESALTTPSSLQSTREFSYLPETTEFAYSPSHDLRLDLGTPSTTEERFSYFPVSARNRLHQWQQFQNDESPRSRDDSKKCSTFKKFAYGMTLYIAVALLALLIIVGILVSSLKTMDNNISQLKPGVASPFISDGETPCPIVSSSKSAIQETTQQPKTDTIRTTKMITTTLKTTSSAVIETSQPTNAKATTSRFITDAPKPLTTKAVTTTTIKPSTSLSSTTSQPTTTTSSATSQTTTITSPTSSQPKITTRQTTLQTQSPTTTSQPLTDPVLCDDTFCSSLAYEMLGRMNTSVDPCSDFFSYSCGAWISSRKVLLDMNVFDADRNSVMSDVKLNLMQRLIEMLEQEVTSTDSDYMAAAKLHFQSCLDSNNRPDSSLVTKDVESLLESLGVGSSMTSFMTPSVMQYSLFSDYGAFGFFTYDVNSRVVGNIKRTILQLSPPDLYLRQSVYLLPYEDNEIGRRYLDRVVPLIQRFNSFLRPTFSNGQIDGLLRAKVQEVFEFERQLSQAIRVAKSSNEENALYPVSALIQNFPNINWTEALPSQQFSTNTPVQLNHPSYFTSLNGMLGRTEKSTLIMYLYIRVILTGIIPFAPKSTRQFMDNLYDTETAQEYTKTYCIDSTLELLPEEVLIEYSGKQNQNVKPVLEYISSLVKNLTDQSIKSFSSYGGYSDKTKLKITETLSSLTLSNAPIPVIPWTVLLSTNKDVFHLFRANYAQQAHSFRLMNRIGEVYSVPNIPWYTIDIVYDEDINTLGISYGILTWKTNLRPEFPFLTTVGLLISEKVTDVIYGALDVRSSNKDWSDASFQHYQDKHDCFMNQLFEKRTDIGIDKTKQIISGHAGLYILIQEHRRLIINNLMRTYQFPFLALQSDQLFYLSMTQEMCKVDKTGDVLPNKLRANTILMNEKAFIDAFTCPLGSPMNPLYKCHLFQKTNYTIPPTTPAPQTTTTTTLKTTTTTTTQKPTTTTTQKPTTQTTTTQRPTTTTQRPPPTTTLRLTTTTQRPTTTTQRPTTTTQRSTTTTQRPTTTTQRPTTTTTTQKPTTTQKTTTQRSTTTTQRPTTTQKPTTQRSTTTTESPTTTTTERPTTTQRPTTTTEKSTTTTKRPTTTTERPTTQRPTTTEITTTEKPTTITTKRPITTEKPTTTPTTKGPTMTPTTTITTRTSSTTPTTTITTSAPITVTTTLSTTTSTQINPTTTSSPKTTKIPTTTVNVPSTSPAVTEPQTCQTGFCYSLGFLLYSRMDEFVNPCDDFYQYACGGWVYGREALVALNLYNESRNSVIEDVRFNFREELKAMVESNVTSDDSEYLQVLKLHYQSCLMSNDPQQVQRVTSDMQIILEILGVGSDLQSFMGISTMHLIVGTDMGGSGIFDYRLVKAVVDNTTTKILQLSPSSLYLKDDAYLSPYENNSIAKKYLERIVPVLQKVNINLRPQTAGENITDILIEKMKEVFAFEQELAKAILFTGFEANIDITVQELEQRYPNIEWVYMLPYQQTFSDTPIRIVNPSFFQTLDQLFNQTNDDVIVMYIYTRAVLTGLLPYTPLAIRKSMDGIYGNDSSVPFSAGHCLDSTLSLLNEEFHEEYRNKHREDITVKTSYFTKFSNQLKQILRNYLSGPNEFSNSTAERILSSLGLLDVQFPSTPSIPWTVTLSNTLEVSFLNRANTALQLKTFRELDNLGVPLTKADFAWDGTFIGFDSSLNAIGIPYPILNFHYSVDPQFPAITTSGWHIAKELTRVVLGDFSFSPLDWSFESLVKFSEERECYNSQASDDNGVLNDIKTGDVMTGGVALDLVTKVYSDHVTSGDIKEVVLPDPSNFITPQQLFYLTFAQQTCEVDKKSGIVSSQYRVNKILRNSEEFQQAFSCPTGSPMNADRKCQLLSGLGKNLS